MLVIATITGISTGFTLANEQRALGVAFLLATLFAHRMFST